MGKIELRDFGASDFTRVSDFIADLVCRSVKPADKRSVSEMEVIKWFKRLEK